LTGKLDYLAGLHVNCTWLPSLYRSPNRDHGYNITDYYGVDRRFGTAGISQSSRKLPASAGFGSLSTWWSITLAANTLGSRKRADIRIPSSTIITSGRTRGLLRATRSWYFQKTRTATWAYDSEAGQYYFHRFYSHQPDLNTSHPAVRREIEKIVNY
jgi:maltose alpha-D-glucosyltransferase/alpha-amylase